MRYDSAVSAIISISSISTEISQNSILSPIHYNTFVPDQPITLNTSMANYADDKVINYLYKL